MTIEEIVKRSDTRAGYRVADYGEVGLPLYEVTLTALCVQRGAPGAIQEFCLRLASHGVGAPADIAGILGLSEEVCNAALAELLRTDEIRLVREAGGAGQVELTARGKETVESGWAERPMEQTVQLRFDGWLRRIVYVPAGLICDSREAKIRGLTTLRAFPAVHPSIEELKPSDATEALEKLLGSKGQVRRILRITRILRIKRFHIPAVAVAFKGEVDDSVQIGFLIDGRESEAHASVFAKDEGIKKLREFRELLNSAQRVPTAEVIDRNGRGEDDAPHQPVARLTSASELPITEVVPVYEHPGLLREALEKAEGLLVVIAPWIRRAVVNTEFLERLRAALRRGVQVYIGYGLGEERHADDEDAIEALQAIARANGKLILKRLGDTHAKILIKDEEYYVISSFNWLSFRGDSERRFREEWGSLVRMPEAVRKFWRALQPRFSDS